MHDHLAETDPWPWEKDTRDAVRLAGWVCPLWPTRADN